MITRKHIFISGLLFLFLLLFAKLGDHGSLVFFSVKKVLGCSFLVCHLYMCLSSEQTMLKVDQDFHLKWNSILGLIF